MSYSSDLILQAKQLAESEPNRPKQASLRRAVSAAYYALFHSLTSDAASMIAKGKDRSELRLVLQRAFAHRTMKEAAVSFAGGTLKNNWKSTLNKASISPAMRYVATAFIDLQQARHEADYDFTRQFSRSEAIKLIEDSEKAIQAWKPLRRVLEGQVLLSALLVHDRISKL